MKHRRMRRRRQRRGGDRRGRGWDAGRVRTRIGLPGASYYFEPSWWKCHPTGVITAYHSERLPAATFDRWSGDMSTKQRQIAKGGTYSGKREEGVPRANAHNACQSPSAHFRKTAHARPSHRHRHPNRPRPALPPPPLQQPLHFPSH